MSIFDPLQGWKARKLKQSTAPQPLPEVSNIQFGDGLKGNLEVVDFMREKAHIAKKDPRVRQLALEIVRGVKSQAYLDEARAIGQFVQKHVRYVRDIKGVETLHDPVTLIDQIKRGVAQADCDDMSLLIASLLLSIGHQPYFRVVRYRREVPTFSHIYVVEREANNHGPRRRLVLDAIIKDKPIGYEAPHLSGRDILV